MTTEDRQQYPASFDGIADWAQANARPVRHAQQRYVQFAILALLAKTDLGAVLVLKGGNALRFSLDLARSTTDLDFTAAAGLQDSEEAIRSGLDKAMQSSLVSFNVFCRPQRVRRNPPGLRHTWPTYDITVGYAFPQHVRFADIRRNGRLMSDVIPLEISINDMICESVILRLADGTSLACASPNDIVAEKLRALLQQPLRNRNRSQDVSDLAIVIRTEFGRLDVEKIARYFQEKCVIRDVIASKSSFDATVAAMAQVEYEAYQEDLGDQFIPFEEAWESIRTFVSSLDIPE